MMVSYLMDDLSQQQLVEFFEQYPLIKYSAKEIIYRPDDRIDQVAFVKKGFVRLYNLDLLGKEITYSGFKPIFFMSYCFIKKNITNQYFFQALTPLELWKAPLVDLDKFLFKNPRLTISILDSSLGSLHEALISWENSLSGDAYNRIGKLLLILCRDYGNSVNGKVTIDFRTTHQLIASMLGLTRETASIQIKKLENDGYISQMTNTLIINDIDKMSKKFV